jgi:hypothetical protein
MKKKEISKNTPTTEFLLYKTPNGDIKVDVLLQNETIWLPQKKIAELFDVNVPAISKHFKNIFKCGELNEEVVVSILEISTIHGAIKEKTHIKKIFIEGELQEDSVCRDFRHTASEGKTYNSK